MWGGQNHLVIQSFIYHVCAYISTSFLNRDREIDLDR